MTLVVDPDDPARVYGTPSWRFRWEDGDARRKGVRGIYRSVDRGETWTYQPYESETGRRDTFSLALRAFISVRSMGGFLTSGMPSGLKAFLGQSERRSENHDDDHSDQDVGHRNGCPVVLNGRS